jgi:hypothetical protein
MLPGDAGNFILPFEAPEVAHSAERFLGLLAAAQGLGRVDLEPGVEWSLASKEGRQIEHVFARQVLHERLHDSGLAPAFLEVAQLQVEVARGLPRQDRKLRRR